MALKATMLGNLSEAKAHASIVLYNNLLEDLCEHLPIDVASTLLAGVAIDDYEFESEAQRDAVLKLMPEIQKYLRTYGGRRSV